MSTKALSAYSQFFCDQDFIEVETPSLVPSAGCDPQIESFRTTFAPEDRNLSSQSAYLITSPEFDMKACIAAGFENIFQICKCWRNGEFLGLHNPEFSMLEFYRSAVDYKVIMEDFETLLPFLVKKIRNDMQTRWQNNPFDWQPPYQRHSISDLFRKHVDLELEICCDAKQFQERAMRAGVDFPDENLHWEEIFTRTFVEKIEPQLPQDRPFFLIDYPKPLALLAKMSEGNEFLAERFELYLGPIEVANGFTELLDPHEQRSRFENDNRRRRELGKPQMPLPETYLQVLQRGLPPCAGVAVGLDRLLMVLLEKPEIKDVLSIPFSTSFYNRD